MVTMSEAATAPEERGSFFQRGLLLLAIIVAVAVVPRLFARGAGGLSGKDAPEIALKYVANAPAGETDLSLQALRGHPVLIDFWATWCGPCRQEVPIVDGIAARYRDQGLAVVGVNTSDERGNAAPFARRQRLSFPIAFDDGSAAAAYHVETLPTLVIVSKTGKIAAVRIGTTSDSELDALIKREL